MHLADQPISAPRDQCMLQDRRVLVVEDNAITCMLMEDGLIKAGAEIVGPACSVDEALGLIEVAAADGGATAETG
jgi:AmiR/NasT family two-component response regulator